MSQFLLVLCLVGLVTYSLATQACCSRRVRMALPLPVESSPAWLIVLVLACDVVAMLLYVFDKS